MNWKRAFGLTSILGFLLVGVYFFVPVFNKKVLIADNSTPDKAVVSMSEDSANTKTQDSVSTTDSDNKLTTENTGKTEKFPSSIKPEKGKKAETFDKRNNLSIAADFNAKGKAAISNSGNVTGKKNFGYDAILEKYLTKIPAAVLSLRINPGIIRSGGNDETKITLQPNGEVIRATQPILSWTKVENATSYRVSLTDNAYSNEIIEKSSDNNLKITKPLERNKTYFFTVTPEIKKDDQSSQMQPSKTAIFRVADEKVIKKLERSEKTGNERKTLSIMLQGGLLGEAEQKLTKMIGQNPNNKFYAKLLKRIHKLRLR